MSNRNGQFLFCTSALALFEGGMLYKLLDRNSDKLGQWENIFYKQGSD
jgi:hypothetical protein